MSAQNTQPTQEQIRKARRAGFHNAVLHMPAERRARFTASHTKQDTRREANVNGFYNTVLSGK